jgi:hypothetical protein
LVDAVSALGGTHVIPICSELIIATDNTTKCIFEGTKDVAPKFVFTTKSSILKKAKQMQSIGQRQQDNAWYAHETHIFIHGNIGLLSGNSDSVGPHQKNGATGRRLY